MNSTQLAAIEPGREEGPGCTFTAPLPADQFAPIRRRLALEHCKWDPQVGDVSTLAPFAVVLFPETWQHLASQSERLAAEAFAAECEVVARPDLLKRLGLPRRISRAIASSRTAPNPELSRVIRFDFHWTTDGWRISEANADVPGGYIEAGAFSQRMAEHFPGTSIIDSPARALAQSIARTASLRADASGTVALLAATGYMEDHQITAYLARELNDFGVPTCRAHPRQVAWRDGIAWLQTPENPIPLSGMVRFYQGEWLARLPMDWRGFFGGSRTPVCNPGSAMIVESKRFGVVWDQLRTPLDTWRSLLPESRDPRRAPWFRDESWLLKAAFCNTGDTVSARDLSLQKQWRHAAWSASIFPNQWVAQRRFEHLPTPTPDGPRYLCLGVYTVDGRARGVYGRLSIRPLIDYSAVDIAVLVRKQELTEID